MPYRWIVGNGIVLVADKGRIGGQQRRISLLAGTIARRGHETTYPVVSNNPADPHTNACLDGLRLAAGYVDTTSYEHIFIDRLSGGKDELIEVCDRIQAMEFGAT